MENILLTQVMGSLLGFLGVLFGAFGAHYLKGKLSESQLQAFDTGVRYQLLHAVLLLVLSFNLSFTSDLESYIVKAFLIGILLFSFSIYGLVLSEAFGKKWRFLGPITPLGGLLLLAGWALLGYHFIANFF
ncbi:DUF423 domain-containing protein [Robiginitalea aurantiaca]|uniref:DUF423 domain-containing protein n=1 Tax=Robiginitalea aurantiaca TaxID=3056915 RepID=A0ABT7WB03_9FLAO|nr:DUF423 domain-containing protein [Robiginitalea aurantiaca]MDM9630082.1 DUF423 domain-containing protein [Robiginitalea aurantiaca]